MSTHTAIEILGYIASGLITLSLMMRSIVRLRWINLAGALAFTVYGAVIRAYPVAVLNALVVVINLVHLWRMRRAEESFAVVTMRPNDEYVGEFLRFHGRDIAASQPSFVDDPGADRHVLAVLRDTVPAGVLILGTPTDGVSRVFLDYVTPAYRDLKVGRHLFRTHTEPLRRLGVRTVEALPGDAEHRGYLERLGFVRDGEVWRLDIARGA